MLSSITRWLDSRSGAGQSSLAVNGPAVVLVGVWRLLLRRPFPYASRQEFLPEAQSRIEKACRLWTGLTAEQSSDPRPGFVGQALRIIAMPVETALRLRADLSPRGHYKGVHRQVAARP